MAKNLTPTESQEQRTFVEWLEVKKLKFTAIPNSTFAGGYKSGVKQKHWGTLVKLHQAGVRRGLPDLVVICPKGLAFVEMKRIKGSITATEQIEWIDSLNTCGGVEARICKGADEAIKFISELL